MLITYFAFFLFVAGCTIKGANFRSECFPDSSYYRYTSFSRFNNYATSTVANIQVEGYPYIQETPAGGVGWVSWPPQSIEITVKQFNPTNGVDSPEACMAKCKENEAPSGAWSKDESKCW